MEGASAEIVQGIVNKQAEEEREPTERLITRRGRRPLQVAIPSTDEQSGPSSDDEVTLADILAHLNPIGMVLPQRRAVPRPQTPDSMPELEAIELESIEDSGQFSDAEESDSEGEYIMEEPDTRPTTSEWR